MKFDPLAVARAVVRSEQKEHAIKIVEQAARLAAPRRPPWWQWTVWLATAITIERIVKA